MKCLFAGLAKLVWVLRSSRFIRVWRTVSRRTLKRSVPEPTCCLVNRSLAQADDCMSVVASYFIFAECTECTSTSLFTKQDILFHTLCFLLIWTGSRELFITSGNISKQYTTINEPNAPSESWTLLIYPGKRRYFYECAYWVLVKSLHSKVILLWVGPCGIFRCSSTYVPANSLLIQHEALLVWCDARKISMQRNNLVLIKSSNENCYRHEIRVLSRSRDTSRTRLGALFKQVAGRERSKSKDDFVQVQIGTKVLGAFFTT